jgi:hypothetical protein
METNQLLFNVIIGALYLVAGWLMKVMWDSLRDLRIADTILAEKVGTIEVLVAGSYAKRDELDKMAAAIFLKLDRIEAKLDTKADK